jgi:hypothetical protein
MNWMTKLALIFSIAVMFVFNLQQAHANPRIMTFYVEIDSVDNTAYVFDESFNKLPEFPRNPKTSMMVFPDNEPFWYVGSNIDVVRRNSDESIDVLSDDSAYAEMIHHLVWIYSTPNRTRDYTCGAALLVPVGSELTNFYFPKGYGYKIDAGVLFPVWHWENPANVDINQKLYLRFNFIIDEQIAGYKDTNIDWVDNVPCGSSFPIPPGESKVVSPKKLVNTDRRIIAVIPHIHDHGDDIKLKSTSETIYEFKPEYTNYPVAHDDMGQGPVLWHNDEKHLPVNGLYPWTPGKYGPIIKAGESLWIESKFKNPHAVDIDNMLIAFVFWEAL